MKVQTTRFGEIEVDDAESIRLPDGLIGFPDLTHFALLDHDSDSPFKWLQSLDEGSMAFVVISPLTFRPDYTVEVLEDEIVSLNLEKPEDAIISVIVTIPSDPKRMSANLKAPIIFNLENRTGKQIVLKDPQYQTKHFIMEELKKYSKRDTPPLGTEEDSRKLAQASNP